MAWQDELVGILRTLVNDADAAAQKYSDDRLEEAVVVAGRLVQMGLAFPVAYACDRSAVTITPDPTVGDGRDENFINLVAVQAACVVDRGSAAQAAGQAILVQDGSSKVDLRDAFKAKLALLNQGWCAVLREMRDEYATSRAGGVVGAAILGPFRVLAGGAGDAPFVTRRPY